MRIGVVPTALGAAPPEGLITAPLLYNATLPAVAPVAVNVNSVVEPLQYVKSDQPFGFSTLGDFNEQLSKPSKVMQSRWRDLSRLSRADVIFCMSNLTASRTSAILQLLV